MFFFFKQKTAYEMRISDWSSDVCSSDLGICLRLVIEKAVLSRGSLSARQEARKLEWTRVLAAVPVATSSRGNCHYRPGGRPGASPHALQFSSEERRVGKECVSTCRSRW